jgi:hypothetical protein
MTGGTRKPIAQVASSASEAKYVHRQCPHALILAGYSQGAMVMHQAELQLAAAHDTGVLGQITGTLLLGDGDRISHTDGCAEVETQVPGGRVS